MFGWQCSLSSAIADSEAGELEFDLFAFNFQTFLNIPKKRKLPRFGTYSSLDYLHNRQLRRWFLFSITILRRRQILFVEKVYKTYTKEELTIEP